MNTQNAVARSSIALAAGALAVGALAGLVYAPAASARPDDEYLQHRTITRAVHPLERIGDQLVRGDDLTGAGVSAPVFVPEAP